MALTSYKEDNPDLQGQRGPQNSKNQAPLLALNGEVTDSEYNNEVANRECTIVHSCKLTRFGSLVIVVLLLKLLLALLLRTPPFPFGEEALVEPLDLCHSLTPLW